MSEMTFIEAITYLEQLSPVIPPLMRPKYDDAVQRTRRKSSRRHRAPTRAVPLVPALARRIRAMKKAKPKLRIVDLAEATGVAFHDISNLLNGTRK